MHMEKAHHGPPMPGAPLSLWPHRLNRYARLQAGLERLEDLRAEMIARLDALEGDPDLEPSLCGIGADPARFAHRFDAGDREGDGLGGDGDFEWSVGPDELEAAGEDQEGDAAEDREPDCDAEPEDAA